MKWEGMQWEIKECTPEDTLRIDIEQAISANMPGRTAWWRISKAAYDVVEIVKERYSEVIQ